MSKKIVALLTNNDDDVYCFRKELIEALIDTGYEVLISCPDGPKFELMKDIPYIYDNPRIDRRGTNAFADAQLMHHYLSLFRRYKPFVALTYTAKPNVYAGIAAKLQGIPYICNVTGLGSVTKKTRAIKKFILWLFAIAYRNAACVMFQNSTNMVLAEQAGMLRGKYRLIPGSGVALERYPVQEYPDGGDGVTGQKVVFNYIGRILHDKGVDDYIAAARIIRAKYPQTEFNMLGFIEPTENYYVAELKKLENESILYYRGSQKDVKPWIQRAHAIIHPSTYGEGMSNVLLENASSGRPIITTDNPGCRETVRENETGYIYPGGNVSELVNKVEQFLRLNNSERKRMGLRGRRYIEQNFSRDVVVQAYLEEIARLMK